MSGTILVVGGGGRNGRAVVRLLGQADAKVRVAGRRPGLIGGKPGGTGPAGGETVDTVWFDWEEPGSYQGALDGASQVYLIAPEGLRGLPGYVRRFMEQAAAAGAEHVVALSAMGVEDRDDLPLRQAELAVMALAPAWTILRPNWFMQNFSSGLFRRGIAERDEIAAPGGDGAISFIDVEDIAASAAAVLTQPWAGNRAHVLTGARALRLDEAADVLSEVAGRVIRYQPLDPDDPLLMERMGLPGRRPEPVQALFSRVRTGQEARIAGDVAALVGREPGSFAAFARRHVADWEPVRESGA
jgi:uncharacterized protein YbjT (DUF2867 family)